MTWEGCGMWGMVGMMTLAAIVWLLLVGGLVAAIVVGVRWMLGHPAPGGAGDAALRILRERYARGEVTPEEFEARRRDLASS